MLKMKHFIRRVNVFNSFKKIAACSRELELELQKFEQDFNDCKFRCDMSREQKDEQLLLKRGFIDGIRWCLDFPNKFKGEKL